MASDAITQAEGDEGSAVEAGADGHLGRYRVDSVLGRGGMGVVLAAYDPELERRVAVKLLRRTEAAAQDALLAEAQAMAKVRHANVVTVYDVGVVDERVFVAMELVTGPTLRAWAATPRSWRAIVTHYAAAGRGLAAAHAAGLIHRDFKPDNALVGDDGLVRVVDFGLAGRDSGAGGAVAGTPAYMAPEQHDGAAIDARADQFAFAVALWEALTGAWPFVGASSTTLHAAKRDGRIVPPRGTAPRWVFALLRRALAAAPAARLPTMDAMVAALERGLGRRRRVAIGVGALAVVAATAVSVRALTADAPGGPDCRRAGDAITAAWNPAVRARVTAALGAAGRPYAATTATLAAVELDRRAAALADARIATCAATHQRGERSTAALDRTMACFDRQQGQLAALATLLGSGPDAETLDRAIEAVAALPPTAACADAATARRPPPSPTRQAVVAAIEARVAEADALRASGKLPAARAAYDALVTEARTLGDPGALADVTRGRARTLGELGDAEAGKEAFRDAATAAAAIGDDRAIAEAWLGELDLLSGAGGAPLEALDRLAFAAIAVERSDDAVLHEELEVVRGKLLLEQGDAAGAQTAFDAARARAIARGADGSLAVVRIDQQRTRALFARDAIDEAMALGRDTVTGYRALLGDDHPLVAKAINNVGIAVDGAGRYDEAAALHREALAIKERVLGPDDPSVAASLNNLGMVAAHQERSPEAIAYYERALAIRERALGPDHKLVATTLSNLAIEHAAAGRLEDAATEFERAIAIRERAEGPDSPGLAAPLIGLASALRDGDHPRDARAPARRALALREAALGPDAAPVAEAVQALADVDDALGDRAAACRGYARADAIVRGSRDDDHPDRIAPLSNLAGCQLDDGHRAEAVAGAEQVVRIVEASGIGGHAAAGARLVLARALWPASLTRPRARTEADRGLADCAAATTERVLECEQLRIWRRAHR